ncbi:hypothetical protein Pmani_006239 [Petrolisthes manimaculis]|uniref:Uncharacterized protein n=1 Tax=Petrolisthes manimaculis TaxID=1843537 RepID=A0AAE1QA83_9EUCA|nr:hypothetical protein Pmani_006239 [Petrolisthes manimaculis]
MMLWAGSSVSGPSTGVSGSSKVLSSYRCIWCVVFLHLLLQVYLVHPRCCLPPSPPTGVSGSSVLGGRSHILV